jgi:hypothetical protein
MDFHLKNWILILYIIGFRILWLLIVPKIACLMLMSDIHAPDVVKTQDCNLCWEQETSLRHFLDLSCKRLMDTTFTWMKIDQRLRDMFRTLLDLERDKGTWKIIQASWWFHQD